MQVGKVKTGQVWAWNTQYNITQYLYSS